MAQFLVSSQSMGADASMLAEKTHSEVIESQQLANNLTLFLIIIIAIIITLTSLVVARSISRPIGELTSTVDSISKGKLDVEINPKLKQSKDEIGDLANAFDRVMVSLKIAMKKIKGNPKPKQRNNKKGVLK